MNGKFVSYLRVSTKKQGESGLGLDAQRTAIANYLNGGSHTLIQEFVEIETGKKDKRPQLLRALELCKTQRATLLLARMDRLSRNAAFLLNLLDSGIEFRAIDLPHADRFLIQILAVVAEKEARLISERTRAGLAEAAKTKKLGADVTRATRMAQMASIARQDKARAFANELAPVIENIKTKGHVTTLRGIAEALTARGYKTPNGKAWQPQSVKNILGYASQRP
jgi:DNA invertase Pin-like site-specific DNA recombinase